MHNYKELKVWTKAIDLSTLVYEITKSFPKDERFGIVSQLRRCSVSISSNIAEGAGRGSDNEFRHFLNMTFGSCAELETQLIISHRLKYLNDDDYNALSSGLTEIQKIVFTLIRKLS